MLLIGCARNGSTHVVAEGRVASGTGPAACRQSLEVEATDAPATVDGLTCGRCARIVAARQPVRPTAVVDDPRPLALAYVRVSTTEQVEAGASLAAQRATLTAAGEARGYRVEVVADEGLSAANMRRPGLLSALDRLDRGDAAALLVVRLDRVSRSVRDFAGLLDRAERRGWRLVMLEPDLDTRTAGGTFAATVLAAAAQFERQLIGQRTREALAQRKADGVRIGGRPLLPRETVERIVVEREAGASLRAIADRLTADGVTTGRGGQVWHASSVRAVLAGSTARGLMDETRLSRRGWAIPRP